MEKTLFNRLRFLIYHSAWLSLTILGFVPAEAFAQVNVTGTVTSREKGETLPGVNVVLKGSTIGSVTGMDGVSS